MFCPSLRNGPCALNSLITGTRMSPVTTYSFEGLGQCDWTQGDECIPAIYYLFYDRKTE
jgi:hypothetical protein